MTTTITAVYEGGLLRPTAPLELTEGTRLRIILLPEEKCAPDGRGAADILAAIAALPVESGPAFSGRDHDQVLYGSRGEP